MRTWFTSNRSILGIDLSTTAVKIIALSQSAGRYCVEGYGSCALPAGACEGPVIQDIDGVAECIRRVLLSSRMNCSYAAIAVPDASTISTIIPIHHTLSEQEIEESVAIEAQSLIPYPIEDIRTDFTILGPSLHQIGMRDVLIVASRADNVKHRLDVVQRAGLQARRVDVESFARCRAAQRLVTFMPPLGSQKTMAVVDIGAVYTRLSVQRERRILDSREEAFGGQQLLQELMQRYTLSSKEVLVALEQGSFSKDDTIVPSFRDSLASQLKRALHFFSETPNAPSLDGLLLAGGVAQLPGIAPWVASQLNLPTCLANPLMHMSIAKNVDYDLIRRDALLLMVACGLALQGKG